METSWADLPRCLQLSVLEMAIIDPPKLKLSKNIWEKSFPHPRLNFDTAAAALCVCRAWRAMVPLAFRRPDAGPGGLHAVTLANARLHPSAEAAISRMLGWATSLHTLQAHGVHHRITSPAFFLPLLACPALHTLRLDHSSLSPHALDGFAAGAPPLRSLYMVSCSVAVGDGAWVTQLTCLTQLAVGWAHGFNPPRGWLGPGGLAQLKVLDVKGCEALDLGEFRAISSDHAAAAAAAALPAQLARLDVGFISGVTDAFLLEVLPSMRSLTAIVLSDDAHNMWNSGSWTSTGYDMLRIVRPDLAIDLIHA